MLFAFGVLGFLLVAGLVGNALMSTLALPEVQSAIGNAMPFIAGHETTLTMAVAGVLALIMVAIPPWVLSRERANGEVESVFEKAGLGVAVAIGIVSVGYLLSVGWLAATATL